ncbi:antigen-presenting glycoprotein CD1d-like [Apteryx mantelli]|uniref:Antigen-presenting glycoprotein CD1d-like n=1 Tax=Apteryx mantelli TaxID=2696672 RepID=A0ABM4FXT8_9AVES
MGVAAIASSSRCPGLTAGTMLAPLLLLLPPGTWLLAAAFPPVPRSYTLQLFQTSTFQNTTSVDTEGLGLLDDIELGFLDHRTWSIHFLQPWVQPALPKGDWDTIENTGKSYLRNFNILMKKKATEIGHLYPFVAQCSFGCELHPNSTSEAFFNIGYEGRDFLTFHVENATWENLDGDELSRCVEQSLSSYTNLNEILQILLNKTCFDVMERFIQYGKEDLERQVKPMAVVFARAPGPAHLLLVCRVTGFYPRPVHVDWLRDGQEVLPGPELNSTPTLPNADLTYQLRSVLAVTPHDGHSYACRVRHSSLGSRSLLVPWGNSGIILTAGLTAAILVIMAVAAITAVWLCRRR